MPPLRYQSHRGVGRIAMRWVRSQVIHHHRIGDEPAGEAGFGRRPSFLMRFSRVKIMNIWWTPHQYREVWRVDWRFFSRDGKKQGLCHFSAWFFMKYSADLVLQTPPGASAMPGPPRWGDPHSALELYYFGENEKNFNEKSTFSLFIQLICIKYFQSEQINLFLEFYKHFTQKVLHPVPLLGLVAHEGISSHRKNMFLQVRI